jgi:hypothetical protein
VDGADKPLDAQEYPKGQVIQVLCAAALWYVPALQLVQATAPAAEYVPADFYNAASFRLVDKNLLRQEIYCFDNKLKHLPAQLTQTEDPDDPVVGDAEPAAQLEHELAPFPDWYVPAVQLEQLEAPVPEYVPAAQLEQ